MTKRNPAGGGEPPTEPRPASVFAQVSAQLKHEVAEAARSEQRSEAWVVREALRSWLDRRKDARGGLFPDE